MRAEDKQEIIELLARYNHAIDRYDAEEWASLFTPDGTFGNTTEILAQGRDALIAFVRRAADLGLTLQHWAGNIVVDGDDEKATVRANVMAFNLTDGIGAPYMLGKYEDHLVKVDDRWRFKRRTVSVVGGKSLAPR